MIQDLDQALRQFLIRELGIDNGQVDISFDQPSRDWSTRRGQQPTLNLFLYDLRENQKLRQTQPMWEIEQRTTENVDRRRRPVRADLHYLVTAWANEPEDEHSLLSRTWLTVLRHAHLPEDVLPQSLHNQPVPIPIRIAQTDELHNPTDIWNVLDNEMRPALACTVTLALDPYQPFTTPLVRMHELRLGLSSDPPSGQLDADVAPTRLWTMGGHVRTQQPLDKVELRLMERDRAVEVGPEGRFVIGPLHGGTYTLEVRIEGGTTHPFRIEVPTADIELEI